MVSHVSQGTVDVVPFTARREWITPCDYELWWDDPRDLTRVVIRFEHGTAPSLDTVSLDYWQSTWPKIRVPKGAKVGAGGAGWLGIDDWTNGRWQPADCDVDCAGDTWTFTFRPLDRVEFPAENDFAVTFRRTLKLRLHLAETGAAIADVKTFTDSEWRQAELTIEWKSPSGECAPWDGCLEAYGGQVSAVTPLSPATNVLASGAWQSSVQGDETGGVHATVSYAANEDPNSYDRTVLTLRSGERTFSFFVDEAIGPDPIYVRDLGALVSRADAGMRLAEYEAVWEQEHPKTICQRVRDLPEQTWERAWGDMPRKHPFYYVLSCEGARQKFGVDTTGEVFIGENYIRRVPGKDTPLLGFEGSHLRYDLGIPRVELADRSILEGYLPVVRSHWVDGGLCYSQEAYAIWLDGPMQGREIAGDDAVVAMVQLTVTNQSDGGVMVTMPLRTHVDKQEPEALALRDDLVYAGDSLRLLWDTNGVGALVRGEEGIGYHFPLDAGAAHTFWVKIPHLALTSREDLSSLYELNYDAGKADVVDFWRARVAEGAQIVTPNETLNDFYRSHLMHMLVINDQEPGADRRVARCGGFHYGSFPDEGCMVISDLDRRGYTHEGDRLLSITCIIRARCLCQAITRAARASSMALMAMSVTAITVTRVGCCGAWPSIISTRGTKPGSTEWRRPSSRAASGSCVSAR
ncbi:MAG: hypothetical protein ACYC5M_01650 [Anaerolineae bacterium]